MIGITEAIAINAIIMIKEVFMEEVALELCLHFKNTCPDSLRGTGNPEMNQTRFFCLRNSVCKFVCLQEGYVWLHMCVTNLLKDSRMQ